MMVMLTLTVIGMAIVRQEPIETGALSVLIGGWCGELLMSLLKRKFEMDDKEDEREEEKEKESEEDDTGEDGDEPWESGM